MASKGKVITAVSKPIITFTILIGSLVIAACSAFDNAPEFISVDPKTHNGISQLPPQIAGCRACHGEDLKGSDKSSNWAPDLTFTGELSAWTEEQFIHALRTGERPFGLAPLDANKMPWTTFSALSDAQLKSLWAYLRSMNATVVTPASPASATAIPQTTVAAHQVGTAFTFAIGTQGDQLLFDTPLLNVKAGSRVTVRFKNNASAGGMKHDWVLVKPGSEDAVAADGIAAGEANNWLKPNDPNVIAATVLAKPGETVEVTFDAPSAGIYPFICSFPGHSKLMRGMLTVS